MGICNNNIYPYCLYGYMCYYCSQLYPTLDVRNVVEASTSVSISDWCPFGKTRCHNKVYTVRPYRCLGRCS